MTGVRALMEYRLFPKKICGEKTGNHTHSHPSHQITCKDALSGTYPAEVPLLKQPAGVPVNHCP